MSDGIEYVDAEYKTPATMQVLTIQSAVAKKLTAFYYALGLPVSSHRTQTGAEFYSARCPGMLLKIATAAQSMIANNVRLSFVVEDLESTIAAVQLQQGKVLKPPHECSVGRQALLADPEGRRILITQRIAGKSLRPSAASITRTKDDDQCRAEAECLQDGATIILASLVGAIILGIALGMFGYFVGINPTTTRDIFILWTLVITANLLAIAGMVGKYRCLCYDSDDTFLIYLSIAFDGGALIAPIILKTASSMEVRLVGMLLNFGGLFGTLTFLLYVKQLAKSWRHATMTSNAARMAGFFAIFIGMMVILYLLLVLSVFDYDVMAFGVTMILFTLPFGLICLIMYIVFLVYLRTVRAPTSESSP